VLTGSTVTTLGQCTVTVTYMQTPGADDGALLCDGVSCAR